MKLTGFEITFTDETTVRFAPRDSASPALMEYEGMMLRIENSEFRIEKIDDEGKGFQALGLLSVKKMDFDVDTSGGPKTESLDIGIRKSCGGGCCVTNGCCDCGGGWLCDVN